MADYNREKRKYVIGAVATGIVLIYIVRLFTLQIMSDDYKKNADSNAFLKKIQYPSRGVITDRNGKLLVYNQPSYDIMVVMNEQQGVDTLDLCASLGITKEYYIKRMDEIKDRHRNPGYSRYTQQLFMSQLSSEEFCVFQEKLFRFPVFMCSVVPSVNTSPRMPHWSWGTSVRCRLRMWRKMSIIRMVISSASKVWNVPTRSS